MNKSSYELLMSLGRHVNRTREKQSAEELRQVQVHGAGQHTLSLCPCNLRSHRRCFRRCSWAEASCTQARVEQRLGTMFVRQSTGEGALGRHGETFACSAQSLRRSAKAALCDIACTHDSSVAGISKIRRERGRACEHTLDANAASRR